MERQARVSRGRITESSGRFDKKLSIHLAEKPIKGFKYRKTMVHFVLFVFKVVTVALWRISPWKKRSIRKTMEAVQYLQGGPERLMD